MFERQNEGVCLCVCFSACWYQFIVQIWAPKGQNPLPVYFVACEMSHYVLLVCIVVQHRLCATAISELTPVPGSFFPHLNLRNKTVSQKEEWKRSFQQRWANENRCKHNVSDSVRNSQYVILLICPQFQSKTWHQKVTRPSATFHFLSNDNKRHTLQLYFKIKLIGLLGRRPMMLWVNLQY